MIEVKLTFATAAEVVTFFGGYVAPVTESPAPAAQAPQEPQAQEQPAPPAAATEAPKRRGRPPKAATEVSPQAPVQTPAVKSVQNTEPAGETPAPITAPTPPTADTVRKALQSLAEKHGTKGMGEVSKFISQFGVQRVSELKPEQYADVIAKVAEAVK